ncbi:MAG: STAS domain-containing protein [Anaerolineae bacterium]
MPKADVTMTVREATDKASIVDIQGEVTGSAENVLMDAYTQASTGGARDIILNFSGLEYMNSSGIGLLVTLLIRVQRQQQRLLAFGLSEHYQQIFELTRLNKAIGIYDTEAEALAAVDTS